MEQKTPDISVIIPIYNVEEYLEACLDSVVQQTKDNLEVIMIDDGSQDGSGAIARRYAQTYPYFHYHKQENGGLGRARNVGVSLASGKYIIFLDSDDMVTPDAYETMFCLAERNQSELTVCNVARFNSTRTFDSPLHRRTFDSIEECTHISKDYNLIYDTTSWNKLILRSFWNAHHFAFPEHILYEDIPVTIPMHCVANNVSVMRSVGYLWRVRDGASKSITQNTSSMDNLKDRLAVMKMVGRFFDAQVTDAQLNLERQKKALEIDLMIFVNICRSLEQEQAVQMLEQINAYLDEAISPSAYDSISALNRRKYFFVRQMDLDSLVQLIEYKQDYYSAPVEERDGRFFVQTPPALFGAQEQEITRELTVLGPRKYINNIAIDGGQIDIFAHLYIARVNIRDVSEQQVQAFLYNPCTGAQLPLPTEKIENSDLTDIRGTVFNSKTGVKTHYNYDGTGIKMTLSLEQVLQNEEQSGWNSILIRYKNRVTEGVLLLSGIDGKVRQKYNRHTVLAGDDRVSLQIFTKNELRLFIQREDNFLQDLQYRDGQIHFALEQPAQAIWAQDASGNRVFADRADQQNFVMCSANFAPAGQYDFYIEKADGRQEQLLSRKTKITAVDCESCVGVFRSNRTHMVRAGFHTRITLAKKVRKEKKHFYLQTVTAGDGAEIAAATQAILCVDDPIAESKVVLAQANCTMENGERMCSFVVDFGCPQVTKDLYQSYREVYVEYLLPDGREIRDLIYSPKYFNHKFKFETLQVDIYRFMEGYVRLRAEQLWRENENTQQKRDALVHEKYPLYRQKKIHPRRILFESMWGSKYSCNPQHLYEYIDANYPEYECIWSLKDARTPVPGHAKRVRRGSQEYYYYLATSKYFVNNVNFETAYVKRDGQIEIQTMHGTPLKTLGLDVVADFPSQASRQQYIEKNHRWNYLIVQGKFMEDKAVQCFDFHREILKTGYPRTDVLYHTDAEKVKQIKRQLGLPLDKKVILYAPTWRVRNRFEMQMDLEKMRKHLANEYILLVRLHHFCATGYEIPADGEFIFDLNAYNCVEDLYQISDLLITDYSSIMFDYALLHKPMLFFTYDLEEYSQQLRGVYVDIEKEAPGPLVFNTDEIIYAINHLEAEVEKCRPRTERFIEKFLTYEQGDSCEEIVQRVLRPKSFYHLLSKIKKR